jgi:hypothetical protein
MKKPGVIVSTKKQILLEWRGRCGLYLNLSFCYWGLKLIRAAATKLGFFGYTWNGKRSATMFQQGECLFDQK